MNNVNPAPQLPPVSDGANFLLKLLDILRRFAAVINGLNEGRAWPYQTVTAAYTSGVNELVLLCAPGAPFTLVLPDVKDMQNKVVVVKRTNNTTHTITVDPAAGNIDDAATVTLTTAYQCRRFFSDGVDYHEI